GDRAVFEEPLRLLLLQSAFGRKLLIDEHIDAGLLRLAFVQLATVLGARLRASIDGASRVTTAHVSIAHMLAERVLRRSSSADILMQHRGLAEVVVEQAPRLAGML